MASAEPRQSTFWMWKSTTSPISEIETDEWERYSDIESHIIEQAYLKDETKTELDEFWIDLKNQVQIDKNDPSKQTQIKRVTTMTDAHIRQERFVLEEPKLPPKSFGTDDWRCGLNFVKVTGFDGTEINDELVEKAAMGIEEEGDNVQKQQEAKFMASELRSIKTERKWECLYLKQGRTYGCNPSFEHSQPNNDCDECKEHRKWIRKVGECCVRLYSIESFLYKLVNKVLRDVTFQRNEGGFPFASESGKDYDRTLGPYCRILMFFLDTNCDKEDIVVYRSAQLTDEMLDDYKNQHSTINTYPTWPSFSSTTQNKDIALKFKGNTLFRIRIPGCAPYGFVNISSLSEYSIEEEVLLRCGTGFEIQNVDYDPEINRNIIDLVIYDGYGS